MKKIQNNTIQKKGLRKYNNKLIAVTISSLALVVPLAFGNAEADAAQTNDNSGQQKTVQSNENHGNGFLNGGLQGNKNNGGSADQSNAHEGNGILNGGAQGNKSNGGDANQKNDHEGNGFLNGGAQGNKNEGGKADQTNAHQGNGVANGGSQGNKNEGG
ncbi:hypothetical protein B9J99_11825, partial [Staphylococcus capitis]|uniref:hypothetical protein n=1 Tax=Staphylococcus capitis TaxID=29388 RepID=UPI000BCD1DD6